MKKRRYLKKIILKIILEAIEGTIAMLIFGACFIYFMAYSTNSLSDNFCLIVGAFAFFDVGFSFSTMIDWMAKYRRYRREAKGAERRVSNDQNYVQRRKKPV